MHFEQRAFVELIREEFPEYFLSSRVLEVGAYDVNGSIRSFFNVAEYIGLDVAPGPGVDVVQAGHEFTSDQPFDIAISCECFEHNPYFRETFANMVKLTRPGGLVVFTCATEGRAEHGTTRTSPESSPGTVLAGIDYYRNVTEQDFAGFDLAGLFSGFRFFVNPGSRDLYFLGQKWPGREELDERLARIAAKTEELTRISVRLGEADRLHSDGEPGNAADLLNEFTQLDNRGLRAHALHKQIWFLMAAKRLDEAERSSDVLLGSNDCAEYLWQRSVLMHALGRNESAVDAARGAVARAPTNSQFQQHLGTLLLNANNLGDAEKAIVLACTLSPLNATAQHRLSMLRLRQRRLEEAVDAAERAVTLAPDNPQFGEHLEKLRAMKKKQGGTSAGGSD